MSEDVREKFDEDFRKELWEYFLTLLTRVHWDKIEGGEELFRKSVYFFEKLVNASQPEFCGQKINFSVDYVRNGNKGIKGIRIDGSGSDTFRVFDIPKPIDGGVAHHLVETADDFYKPPLSAHQKLEERRRHK